MTYNVFEWDVKKPYSINQSLCITAVLFACTLAYPLQLPAELAIATAAINRCILCWRKLQLLYILKFVNYCYLQTTSSAVQNTLLRAVIISIPCL